MDYTQQPIQPHKPGLTQLRQQPLKERKEKRKSKNANEVFLLRLSRGHSDTDQGNMDSFPTAFYWKCELVFREVILLVKFSLFGPFMRFRGTRRIWL
jgi:hypothetical protein